VIFLVLANFLKISSVNFLFCWAPFGCGPVSIAYSAYTFHSKKTRPLVPAKSTLKTFLKNGQKLIFLAQSVMMSERVFWLFILTIFLPNFNLKVTLEINHAISLQETPSITGQSLSLSIQIAFRKKNRNKNGKRKKNF
jgi:hypothetical protein